MGLLMNACDTDKREIASNKVECKFCNEPLYLSDMRQLPKKKIIERHGLYWSGIETLYLLIYKIQCSACKKKYSHKIFQSHYLYK